MNAPVVRAEGLTRRYGDVVAVAGADLAVGAGEVVGICGPSGGGKSTLLRMLAGLERPDSGTLAFDGAPARGVRRAVYPRPGYVMPVFQDPYASLDARWPLWRSITEALTVRARGEVLPSRARRQEIARDLLDRAGMADVPLGHRPFELSGGQCQRVAVLRALAARPALLVADEPTARQDVLTAVVLGGMLTEAATAGAAVVVVSHDRVWLRRFATRILDLREGALAPAPRVVAD